ncbi:MAG: hypothetical protein ABSB80_11225 [Methanoregula sp.]|jgi:hypothetical protein|uniref:hypothetical protein n=1 Tax=Methanoregula sp. TaxID=2052170 RepID=UPI003D0F3469
MRFSWSVVGHINPKPRAPHRAGPAQPPPPLSPAMCSHPLSGSCPNAGKYTGKFRDGTPITFRVVPDIPVPVRLRFPGNSLEGEDPVQAFELKRWE